LNALANHNLLPHSGVGITKDTLSSAMSAIGMSSAVAAPLISGGMGLGSTGSDGVQRLNLDQLNQ
jgi:hypothetical protein